MMRKFRINDKVVLVEAGWGISDKINARTTLSCTVIDLRELVSISDGDTIVVTQNGTKIFAGIINDIEDFEPYTGILNYSITAVDNSALADKRTVANSAVDIYAGDVVKNIILPILSEENVTAGNIVNGPIMKKVVFNYIPCSDALNYLKNVTGLNWNIDNDKKLHFFDRSHNLAPFTLSKAVQHVDFRRKRSLSQYRNKQYIRAGKGKTITQVKRKPTPQPDGVSKSFIVRFPIAEKPDIYINSVQVAEDDIGVNGLDKDRKFYFSYGSNVIAQDQSEPVLISSDVIEVSYKGLYPIMVVVDSPEEIEKRKAKEPGTSGIYEKLVTETSLDTGDQAVEFAEGLISKYGNVPDRTTFRTNVNGLKAGQLLAINKPLYGLNENFLIESVNIRASGSSSLEYDISALDGAALGGWEEFFKDLLKGQREFVIAENEVIILLISLSETWKFSQELTVEFIKNKTLNNNTFTSVNGMDLYTSIGSSEEVGEVMVTTNALNLLRDALNGDSVNAEINYIAIGDDTTAVTGNETQLGNELKRVPITSRSKSNDGVLDTVAELLDSDGAYNIREVGFIAGGTDTVNSGTLISRVIYSKDKTTLESLRFNAKNTIKRG
ncbi:hypothetical protein IMX26_13240 [Clostridium sp. 'deep sea']|uniref:hypothetical protein n=1 Tax=Clostridium sp. 'deep sea' TaxID=2779445 RepID=UPI00189640B3|nr:hypothetical protein [Clostridium sp. 'deep sea']QOR34446.1 hypothetical protein IMX26_13240 [Clostridium sp. 'deep sea']